MWVVEQDSHLHWWGEDNINFATMSNCLEGVLPDGWDAYSAQRVNRPHTLERLIVVSVIVAVVSVIVAVVLIVAARLAASRTVGAAALVVAVAAVASLATAAALGTLADDLDINLAQQVSCTTTARTCYAPTLRPDP